MKLWKPSFNERIIVKFSLSTTTRITLGLTGLSVGCLLAVHLLGMIPDAIHAESEGRCALAESVAVQCCLAAQHDDLKTMRAVLGELVVRNDWALSAAVRRGAPGIPGQGQIAVEVGDHRAFWQAAAENLPRGTQLKVPIFQGRELWGELEVRCRPLAGNAWLDWLLNPAARLIIFLAASAFAVHHLYLKRVLRLLDPTAVVPDRVRATLDTLAEGVVILDNQQQIVLANKAFADRLGKTPDTLQGLRPAEFGWSQPEGEIAVDALPWVDALRQGTTRTGVVLRMPGQGGALRTLSVNAMPIVGSRGERRGALATFDDVTKIEEQNLELARMLAALKDSRDEIQRQNRELYQLATFDPLTRCLNRRSFFEKLETHWASAVRYGHPLSFIMVDVDHFKAVNDRFGHSTGDVVLQKVGETLRAAARDCDLVCRYGGEEFCILLPHLEIQQAAAAAERYREAVQAMRFEQFTITVSLGVAAKSGLETSSQDLLELADKALYAAKRGGRNRLVRGDRIDQIGESAEAQPPAEAAAAPFAPAKAPLPRALRPAGDEQKPIDIHVIRTLNCAMAYRDPMTARHCREVADVCVLAARDLLSQYECYELEIAALLHDVGKLAIPDAILFKPDRLSADEWVVMRTHDRIGSEILDAGFASPSLTRIVAAHHAWYAGNPEDADLPRGEEIPLAARILSIADAFMAIVADRHYRKGRSQQEAFRELRRCAGTQFDPLLVEHFIKVIEENDRSRPATGGGLSKETVLDIGLQIERLASALDMRDYANLGVMARQLAGTAARGGAVEIAELATRMESSATDDPDLMAILQLTSELLDVCRSTQSAFLARADDTLPAGQQALPSAR
jgi:diguanylate cyclase (GGDEF)-like protein/PAS domain S-box-containing protein